MGLGMRSDGANGESSVAMESGHGKPEQIDIAERWWNGASRAGLLHQLVASLPLLLIVCLMVRGTEQVSPAALCFCRGWQRGRKAGAGLSCHILTLLRFRTVVENSLVTPGKVT